MYGIRAIPSNSSDEVSSDQLITDDSTLCSAAFDRGTLERLVAVVQELTPEENKTEWGEDEAESTSLLREVSLIPKFALGGADVAG